MWIQYNTTKIALPKRFILVYVFKGFYEFLFIPEA